MSIIYHIHIAINKSLIETFHQIATTYLVNLVLQNCTLEKTDNWSSLPNIDPLFALVHLLKGGQYPLVLLKGQHEH